MNVVRFRLSLCSRSSMCETTVGAMYVRLYVVIPAFTALLQIL